MNALINLEIKILALYNRLCLLEVKGQKNSDKYRNILIDLKKKLNQETEFLKNFDLGTINPDKLREALERAAEINEAIQIRIMMLLVEIIANDISKAITLPEPEIYNNFLTEIQTNISMFTAKYLSDLMQAEKDENTKKTLIINFYDLCYLQPRLGALLLEDSFEIRDEYFKSCYFIADILKINRDDAQKFIDDYCTELCLNELNTLFSKEANTDSDNREIYLKELSCSINAIFTMFSNEGFDKAKTSFFDMVKKEQLSSHTDYEYMVNLFEQFNKSQDKVATITFGKPL